MKLSNRTIIELVGNPQMGMSGALNDAHGKAVPIKGEDGKAAKDQKGGIAIDTEPYDLEAGVRMTLAIIMTRLKPCAEAFELARSGVVKVFTAKSKKLEGEERKWRDAPLVQQHPYFDDCQAEVQKLLDKEVDIPRVPRIKVEALKPNENKIPPDVIARLSPILDMSAVEKDLKCDDEVEKSPSKR